MYSKIFPLLSKGVYLNTAYVGLMSKELVEFRANNEKDYLQKGEDYKKNSYKILEEAHTTISRFFGVNLNNAFVVNNFSSGIRHVIRFLPKKLKVLLIDNDYPSLISAFEEEDFLIHKVPMLDIGLEDQIDDYISKNQIDILALSIVQYSTGLLIDINFLESLKLKYPNLILIGDGTQFLGAHKFSFDSSPFDIVAGSGYKWLLAGFGNGVLMISKRYLDLINKEASVIRDIIFKGHFNILATASLNFAIKSLEKQGFENLMNQKAVLTEKVKNSLSEINQIGSWVSKRKQHSSIFILEGNKDLFKNLKKSKIHCVLRGKGIRISFHYYNTEEDLLYLENVLKENN